MPAGAQTIEGRRTLVVPTGSGLPRKMPDLLAQMASFGFAYRDDFTLSGTRTACTVLREHRLRRFREGRWFARDGARRGEVLTLHLRMCQDCGAVEVRDVSYDLAWEGEQIPIGRGGPFRRDHLMDWYSGKRPRGQQYL